MTMNEIPLRLDFLMSDSKKGVVSTTQVTMTTTDDVIIFFQMLQARVLLISTQVLLDGRRMVKRYQNQIKQNIPRQIGKEKDFSNLISKYAADGIDLSLSRDFVSINRLC